MDNLIQLIGRLHPLIVHLPIGIMALALGLQGLVLCGRYTRVGDFLPLLWLLSFISALLACIAGYCLSLQGGYGPGAVDTHMWLGIGLMFFSGAMYVILQKKVKGSVQVFVVIAVALLLPATGHYGGNLTHGENYLTQPIYALLGIDDGQTVREPITDIREARVYEDLIVPVLDQKCYQCHSSAKQKGGLRLDTKDDLLRGGEHGKVIVAGDASQSSLYTRLILPEGDDEHMPPKGKPQLTENETKLIQWWLADGKASFSDKVADIAQGEQVKTVLAHFAEGSTDSDQEAEPVAPEIPTVNVGKPDPALVQQLEKMGVAFTPLTADHSFLSANMVNHQEFNDKELDMLSKLKDHLVWLDLSDTQITDTGLSKLTAFKHLTRLSLDHTGVTDEGMSRLGQLPALQYLNLYNTRISDKGLLDLAACKSLKKVYVWKTQVTPDGVAAFHKRNGEVVINAGSKFLNDKQ